MHHAFQHGLGWQREWLHVSARFKTLNHFLVAFAMNAVFYLDVLLECAIGVCAKSAFYRPGFNQADVNIRPGKLQAQGVAESFDGELAGIVRAAHRHRGKSEYRAVLNNTAVPLCAHDRNEEIGQLHPAEYIGFELLAHRLAAEIFTGAGLTIGAVVKQGI